jgi:glycosyltransferase involved in cell wall biosynthesis
VRVAVVADQLSKRGGAERVFLVMAEAFPGSRLLTSFFDPAGTFDELAGLRVETSRLNRAALLRDDPRRAFPLMRSIFEGMRLDDVDAVLCSSAGWSHGVRTTAARVVYCHNPPRWFYQTDSYLQALPPAARRLFLAAFADLQAWDRERALSASRYLVNSTAVAQRVREAYGITATVLHPPVPLRRDAPLEPVPGLPPRFLLTVGRPRSYKNTDLVCQVVAERPDQDLVVVGGLPPAPSAAGWPSNVHGLSRVSDAQLRWLYASADAVVTMAEEDFGLTPIEGFAFGTPALAVRAGGFLDTVTPGVTGDFVDDFTPEALDRALRRFDPTAYSQEALRAAADRFSVPRFTAALQHHVMAAATAAAAGPVPAHVRDVAADGPAFPNGPSLSGVGTRAGAP